MNPAKLNRRITIQREGASGTDAEGIPIEGWEDFVTIWAAERALNGREYFAAAAVNAENTVRYEIRRRHDIKPSMRVKDGERILDIIAVMDDPFGDRSQTRLMCKEAVSGG